MALEMNTIGVKLKWASEVTAGSRPTSGFAEIPDLKEIPGIENTPSQLEVTNLVDTHRRYIPGVIDSGNDFALTANMTASMKTAWASMKTAADAAWASGKSTWFEICIPNFDSFYFAGRPTELGASQLGVDAVIEASLHIIPNQIAGWATAST